MQNSKLQVFSFGERRGTQIRVQVINHEPWFVAKDVCRILGIENHKDAVSRLDDDERGGVGTTDPLGGRQTSSAISESGLYHLIFQSRKPEAKKFRKWVTGDVLPSIRRTGRYEGVKSPRLTPRRRDVSMCDFFDELTKWVTISDEREVAEMFQVTQKHVHDVMRGQGSGITILDILTGIAKENRKKGIRREVRITHRDSEIRMERLRNEFMSCSGKERSEL